MCVFGFFNTCSQKPQETRESMSWVLDPRGLISVSLFSRRNRYGNISFDKCCHLTWTKILCYKKEEKSNISRLKVTLTDLLKQTVFAFFSSLLVQAKLNGWHEFHFILYSANVSSNLFFLDIVLPSSKTFLSYFKVVLSHSSPGFA